MQGFSTLCNILVVQLHGDCIVLLPLFVCVCVYYFPFILSVGFPCGSAGKESACNAGDLGLIPGLGRSPGEGNSYPLQYSGLQNSMDCMVHGIPKSRTQLSNFTHILSVPVQCIIESDQGKLKGFVVVCLLGLAR